MTDYAAAENKAVHLSINNARLEFSLELFHYFSLWRDVDKFREHHTSVS